MTNPRLPEGAKQSTITLYKGEQQIIDDIREALGVPSMMEVIRTSLRVYHAILVQSGQIKKKRHM